MAQAETGNKPAFSADSFLRGLSVVVLLYALLSAALYLTREKAGEILHSKLASQTVIINWQTAPRPPHAQETPAHENPAQNVHTAHETPPEPAIPHDERTAESLLPAPIEGLYETTDKGPLPQIRHADDMTPFMAYRRPFTPNEQKPYIAIAIADIGISDIAAESAMRTMPPEVSLILSPYAPTPDFWAKEARNRGHEVWLSLPMETDDYPLNDPGPNTIMVDVPEQENLGKLNWLMTRTAGYAGFVAKHNNAVLKSPNDLRPVLGALYNRGLGFIDASATPGMIPQSMALGMNAPYGTADLWIDEPEASQDEIDKALAHLEELARENGSAAAILHPLPVSYQQLLEWIKTLPEKGLQIAPLSAATEQKKTDEKN